MFHVKHDLILLGVFSFFPKNIQFINLTSLNTNVPRETIFDAFRDVFHYFLKGFQFIDLDQNTIVSRETLLVYSYVILR